MKLVDILARELDSWRCGAECATQEMDSRAVYFWKSCKVSNHGGEWFHDTGMGLLSHDWSLRSVSLASDHATAIVTREMWQAERERIAKPAKKANAEGWIRNRGRKCPVQSGTLVDLKLRGGVIHIGKFCDNHPWIHKGEPFDVMYYRINKTAEQPADQGIYADDTGPAVAPVSVVYADADCPLVWRDRIREIDRTVEALEEERVSLIQRLEGEGLQLLQGKVCGSVQPVEDMSDWRNWKVGDLVEYVGGNDSPYYMSGVCYPVEAISEESFYLDDEDDGHHQWTHSKEFVWHSRPFA